MKFLLLDASLHTTQLIDLAVRFRWPDAGLLIGRLDDAQALIAEELPDAVVLQLRGSSSTAEAVRKVRSESNVPVIALGDPDSPRQTDEVVALEAGADDYVHHSSSFLDLVARIMAVIRRTSGHDLCNTGALSSGPLMLDPASYEVFLGDRKISLTTTEFRILHLLLRNHGRVVTHQFLGRVLWDDHADAASLVKKYVQRIRQKLGEDGRTWIINVHSVGYRLTVTQGGPRPLSVQPLISDVVNR